MQIQLKQLEIVAALKMFINSQGINLTGKTVEIAFTSGRKDNGLSAEITIEDANIAAHTCSYTAQAALSAEPEAPLVNNTTSETTPVVEESPPVPAKPASLFNS